MPSEGVPGALVRLQMVREPSYREPPAATPPAGDVLEIVLLDRANGQIVATPMPVTQRVAAGGNKPGRQKVGRVGVPVRVNTYLYNSQASALIHSGFTPFQPVDQVRNVLQSWQLRAYDGYAYRKFAGFRMDECGVQSAAGSDFVMIDFSGVGAEEILNGPPGGPYTPWDESIFGGDYDEPAGDCFIHQDSEGHILAAGIDLTSCRSISVRVRNVMDHRHRGGRYVQRNSYNGRDVTIVLVPYSDDDTFYLKYRDQVPDEVTVGWYLDQDAGNKVEFQTNNMAYLAPFSRSTDIATDVEETQTWTGHEVDPDDPDIVADVQYTPAP